MQHKPIIPWVGGKRRLAKTILPLYPKHTCYVEPFAGGAALLFLKEPSKVEVINDINGDLINLYRIVQNHLEEFVRQFKWSLTSREIFKWEQMKRPETLTDIQRAVRFFYLQKNAFGAKVKDQAYGYAPSSFNGINLLRIEENLSQAHLRLSRVNIENLTWQNIIKRYDRDYSFFFCDPPYWQTEKYTVDFGWSNYEQLAELMKSIKGKMIITLNNHKDIVKLFNNFNIKTTDIKYTLSRKKNAKVSKEIIIMNY